MPRAVHDSAVAPRAEVAIQLNLIVEGAPDPGGLAEEDLLAGAMEAVVEVDAGRAREKGRRVSRPLEGSEGRWTRGERVAGCDEGTDQSVAS